MLKYIFICDSQTILTSSIFYLNYSNPIMPFANPICMCSATVFPLNSMKAMCASGFASNERWLVRRLRTVHSRMIHDSDVTKYQEIAKV